MRSILSVLLTGLLCICLASCAGQNKEIEYTLIPQPDGTCKIGVCDPDGGCYIVDDMSKVGHPPISTSVLHHTPK